MVGTGKYLGFAVGAALLTSAGPAAANCGGLASSASQPVPRAVTARDIFELNEIGFPDGGLSGPSPLGLSPDGHHLAFIVTRADIEQDRYCRFLVTLPLRPGAAAQIVDKGGEFMPLRTFARGLHVTVGLEQVVTPLWSPDGLHIAFLKRIRNVTQAIVVSVDGKARPASTRSAADVEDLWWSSDGHSLFFTSRPGLKSAERAIDREGEGGWLYDDRFAPNYAARPRVQAAQVAAEVIRRFDLHTGLVAPGKFNRPIVSTRLRSARGEEAWLTPQGPSPVAGEILFTSGPQGLPVACGFEACKGRFQGLWWSPDGHQLWFLKREGFRRSESGLYRWDRRAVAPVRTLLTTDVIDNCVPAVERLACTTESSTRPRTVILIDPLSGSQQTIFDPNPRFRRLPLGSVRRLTFRNERGLEAWADLVLPSSHREGERLPMIVVQYSSRGFLRGGTGNEYPIYPLVAAGYAILSIDRPPPIGSLDPSLRTDAELNAANERGWAERRSVQSSILRAIDLAITTGAVDPARIGITGLSDGATAARFALINSERFAAAAISSCCIEPKTAMTYGGIRWAKFNRDIGYPPATVDAPEFWRPVSTVLNAGRMHAPLLIQQSDDEYLLGLEAFTALKEKGAPVELYVFPDEHHIKWQPKHKLAVFERARDWFDFWLRCKEDPSLAKREQYRRWAAMRTNAGSTAALCPRFDTIAKPVPKLQRP